MEQQKQGDSLHDAVKYSCTGVTKSVGHLL